MSKRAFNFSAGPAVLPVKVLEQASAGVMELGNLGMSILEISHRSKGFEAVMADAKKTLHGTAGIPANYSRSFCKAVRACSSRCCR